MIIKRSTTGWRSRGNWWRWHWRNPNHIKSCGRLQDSACSNRWTTRDCTIKWPCHRKLMSGDETGNVMPVMIVPARQNWLVSQQQSHSGGCKRDHITSLPGFQDANNRTAHWEGHFLQPRLNTYHIVRDSSQCETVMYVTIYQQWRSSIVIQVQLKTEAYPESLDASSRNHRFRKEQLWSIIMWVICPDQRVCFF